MRCALANAVWRLSSVADADRLLGTWRLNAASLAGSVTWIERNGRIHTGREPSYFSSTQEWLLQQTQGVFLVRVEGRNGRGGVVDHAISIDAASPLVLDVCERFALPLDPRTLMACVGDDVSL